jgi:hypothetical protein
MKKISILPAIILFLTINLFYGCSDLDDKYSTNQNHLLTFSKDTLAFDTVFTTIGSATKTLMVYNENRSALNIESISLAQNGSNGFRINIDGRKGREFSNIGILPRDSMYIFVEITVDPTDQNQPLEVKDSLIFRYNGIRQSILLQAYGQDAHIYKGGVTINSDTTLTAERPYLVYDSLVFASGTTTTIEQGARFYMHDKAKIIIDGTVIARGTMEEPIIFRGDRLDEMLEGRLSYDNTPGQWSGITIGSDSYDNVFEHVTVRSANYGIICHESSPERMKISIGNSQITNITTNLLYSVNCRIDAYNSEFTNAGDSLIYLEQGEYNFAHCTIANFITLTSRTAPSVIISEETGESGIQVSLDNCIIDGSYSTEINVPKIREGIAYRFNHCFIKNAEKDEPQYTESIFSRGSLIYHKRGGEENQYNFDFRLKLLGVEGLISSDVIGQGDPEIAKRYPTDRYGISRDNSVDIGAYQYVHIPEDEE